MHSRALYAGDASTRLFAVPFPYLAKTDVKVYLNKFPLNHPMDYRWVGDAAVELTKPPKQNDAIEVARTTEDTRALVQFQNGAVLTEQELNLAMLQMLYLLQETRDAFDAALGSGLQRIAGNTGILGATAEDIINNVVAEVLDSELTAVLQQRISDIDLNAQELISQKLQLKNLDDTIAALTNIDGQSIATFLMEESEARIEGDNALASKLSLIGAANAANTAFVLDLAKVLVGPSESLGTRLEAIRVKANENGAAITAEATARANADGALATRVDGVAAQSAANAAAIVTEQTARANADGALSTRIDNVQAQTGANTAAIQTETTARTNAVGAVAASVQTLQTKVDGNTASIQTQQQTINGLSAQYTVKLDVNGYVAGFGLWNQGGSAQFTILADRFALVTPGKNPVVPFVADANGVYMDTAYIRNLTVDRITGGNINSQWNLINTSGRIVLDTGTHMKVLGVGFGANADLIEWFGPKMAINECTKFNAITYVGTNGDAYFGGSLRAGTLYNAQRTTNTQVPTDVVLGPYGTNGAAKVVVVSYSFSKRMRSNAMGTSGFTFSGADPYADIQLYRKLGTLGSEVLIATFRVGGTVSILNEVDGPDSATVSIGGSYTYTDNTPGTDDRTYTARVINRYEGNVGHPGQINSITPTSSLGIVSTEQ